MVWVRTHKSGPFYYRCLIPKSIQPYLQGKSEFKISLSTGLEKQAHRLSLKLQEYANKLFIAVNIRRKSFSLSILKNLLKAELKKIIAEQEDRGYVVTKKIALKNIITCGRTGTIGKRLKLLSRPLRTSKS